MHRFLLDNSRLRSIFRDAFSKTARDAGLPETGLSHPRFRYQPQALLYRRRGAGEAFMVYLIGLSSALAALWMLLSGHSEPYLLALGALSIALTVAVLHKLRIADHEAMPLHLIGRGLRYWPWLIWEIVKANWDVAKIIANPKLPISPTMTRVTASQKTELGRAIYANSITLTPGTISVDLEDDQITVHALTSGGADGTEDGSMDQKVSWLENAP